jgi:N-acetyl-gamma-glutamyl-phosphate reductase
MKIGIVGASGYGGAELLRLLDAHPELDVAVIAAHSQADTPVRDLFPNLATDARFTAASVEDLGHLDLVFLSTPHKPAFDLAGPLFDAGVPVVDLSAAYRLPPDEFAEWYGEAHPHPDAAPAVYGLTEWNREEIGETTFVANPGCYPTAALLALLPVASIVEPSSVVIDAKSGTSGAGRGLRDNLHHSHAHADVSAYGAPRHRHTGEIENWLTALGPGDLGAVSFTPHLMPMTRGLLATCYATLREGVGASEVTEAFDSAYADETFVRVLPPGTFPKTKALSGSNGCQISAIVDDRTGRVVITSAIDNLGKGAAGQALQNANLMLGLDEGLGLTPVGIYP